MWPCTRSTNAANAALSGRDKPMTATPTLLRQTSLVIAMSCIALALIGGADSIAEKRQNIADQELFFAPVPKAVCGPGDKPETGLQVQVPIGVRMQPGGFPG